MPAPPKLRIDYRLTGPGWAECDVAFGEASVELTDVSYLGDALGALISAMSMLLQGAGSARARFETEPGQYRWGFDHAGDGALRVRIWWFHEACSTRPDEQGEVIFDQVIPERAVHRAALRAADNVLNIHGTEVYEREWRHPFPAASLAKVRALFRAQADEASA